MQLLKSYLLLKSIKNYTFHNFFKQYLCFLDQDRTP